MKYIAADGRTAELMGQYIDLEGRVIANIDGKAQAVDYREFIKEFNSIAKDEHNSGFATTEALHG